MRTVKIAFYGYAHGGHVSNMDAFLSRWWFLTDHYLFIEVGLDFNPDIVYFTGKWKQPIPSVDTGATRVFVTGENIRPDFSKHEYAFTFDRNPHQHHFRLPEWIHWLWSVGIPPENLIRSEHEKVPEKKRFCLFVQKNPNRLREDFVQRLSKYKPVDCLGERLNTTGYTIPFRQISGKIFEVMRDYKFVVAFDNESYPGYNVRLANPLVSRSIPIYWGDPLIDQDFNERCFVHVRNEKDIDRAIGQIKVMDRDDDMYHRMWAEPYYIGNVLPKHADRKFLTNFWHKIIGA